MNDTSKEGPVKKDGASELESVRSDAFARLYANSARVETTIWDVKIFFGELVPVSGGKPFIEESACVAMSPQHAKALIGVLTQNINQYETAFGKLPSPPEPVDKEPPKKHEVLKKY
jgi:flagellar protein FlaG